MSSTVVPEIRDMCENIIQFYRKRSKDIKQAFSRDCLLKGDIFDQLKVTVLLFLF